MIFSESIPFPNWVNDNNPDSTLSYSKGWWDYIEFINYLSTKFESVIFVVGTYEIKTPPPTEKLTLPIIQFITPEFDCYLKEYFPHGGFADEWFVSVSQVKLSSYNDLTSSYLNSLSSHLKKEDMREDNITYNDYSLYNTKQFTGTINDSHDLYAFLKHLKLTNSLKT